MGTAIQGGERSAIIDAQLDGGRLTWRQQISKPMKLNLKFDVTFAGDRMNGTARAGLLPASKLEGRRL